MAARFKNLRDMFDGGGKGQSGDQFQGGVFSDFLNRAGVRPIGYAERQAAPTAPMPRPTLRETAGGGATLPTRMMMSANSMADRAQNASNYMPPRAAAAVAPAPAQHSAFVGPNGVMVHGGSAGQPNKGGRGTVGMPLPPYMQDPEVMRAVEKLRSLGMISM